MRGMATRSAAWVAAAAAVSLLAAGCSGEKKVTPVVRVETATAQRKAIDQVVTVEGVLYPGQEAALTPKASAPVEKFYVNRGSEVRAGQLLAVLQNSDAQAAALENRGAYEQAQANYESTVAAGVPEEMQKAELEEQQAKQAYAAAEQVYRSREALFKQGAIARKEVDQAGVAATEARSKYQIAQRHLAALEAGGKQRALTAAQGELKAAQGKYMGAVAQLKFTEIRSPIDGVVTDRLLFPGEVAAADKPLITVMNLSQVVARTHVSENEAAVLKVGDAATITAPGKPPVAAKVTIVSPAVDANSTTVEVWVEAANRKHELRPGTTVQVAMTAQHIPDAIVVPASAVLPGEEGGGKEVMVVTSDGHAHATKVEVGVQQGNEVQIVSGLQAGQQVITQGAFGLPDGTQVQVENQQPATPRPAVGAKAAAEHDQDER